MKTANRFGFTLVELLVVIGILGILSGVLIASLSGSSDSARAAQCLSNLRNLTAACQTYGSTVGRYPLAGSIEYMRIDESRGMAHAKAVYHEVPGWISWASMGAYKNQPSSHQSSASWMTSLYADDYEQNLYCITNGAVWRYLNNRDTYTCPDHARTRKEQPPQWSYVMNAYFGWDSSKGSETQGENFSHLRYGDLNRADRILLFAEIQFANVGLDVPDGTGSGTKTDCVLQYATGSVKNGASGANDATDGNESIGVNHKSGKNLYAHVAFADGHVEKLTIPHQGSIKNPKVDETQLKELTAWLCTGDDVSFDGKKYQRLDK